MTGLDGIRSALGQSCTAIEHLCAGLSPAQWQAQSLCPDWTARAVGGHLASVGQMLAGWQPASAGDLPPSGRVTAFAQQTAALDDAAFAARAARTSAGRTWPRSARTTSAGRHGRRPGRPATARSWPSASSTSGCTSATSPPPRPADRRP